MDPKVTRISDKQVQLFDEQGRFLGVITRPVVLTDVLGPGREKVYLARHRAEDRAPQAA